MVSIHDFNLKITPSDTDYIIQAECLSVGEAGPHPIKKERLSNLSAYDYSTAQIVGRNLYKIIFQSDIGRLFDRALAITESESSRLRLLFKFKQSQELHEIPWELLHDGQSFLAVNPRIPMARYLEQFKKVESLKIEPPVRVLFTTACPSGFPPLDLSTEERHMRSALKTLSKNAELTVKRNISIEQLQHTLLRAQNWDDRPFHIWHHCGHGGMEKGEFVLILEERSKKSLSTVKQLSTLMQACPALRVVTLNVCHSAFTAGLVPALANLNVPAVIGFRGSILDKSALAFAEAFYDAMFHTPLDVAVSQARMALMIQNNYELDWTLPLLFLRTTTPMVLERNPTKSSSILHNTTEQQPITNVGIPPSIYKRLQTTLLNCGPFSSNEELKNYFVDSRIAQWHDRLHETTTTMRRVQATIDFLSRQHNYRGENALVLLLYVLSDQISLDNHCHYQLIKLSDELRDLLSNRLHN